MAIITMPTTLRCAPGCRIEQLTTDAIGLSDPGGNGQARTYGYPKWALSLAAPEVMEDTEAGAWKALLLGLRGSVNYLHAYDPSRPAPRGTLRGSLTLGATVAAGATTATLACGAGQAGKTLVVGDWLQISTGLGTSQLVFCMANATVDGSGNMALVFEGPLRQGFAAGTAVTWDRPRSYFRKPPGRVGWTGLSTLLTQNVGLELIEAW